MSDKNKQPKVERDENGRLKKGTVLNPEGIGGNQPSIVCAIKRKLKEEYPEDASIEEKRTYLDKIVEEYFNKIIDDGNRHLLQDVIDRVDGKPVQTNKIEGEIKTDEIEKRNNKLVDLYDQIKKDSGRDSRGSSSEKES